MFLPKSTATLQTGVSCLIPLSVWFSAQVCPTTFSTLITFKGVQEVIKK